MTRRSVYSRAWASAAGGRGFSLLEVLVAIAVFLIISSVAFTLFNNQQKLLTQQQGISGLNIGLRNALTQIQIDSANSANGLMLGAYTPAWPVGAVIVNQNPGSACNTGSPLYEFNSGCFDTLIIILADRNTPSCNLAANLNTHTASTVNVIPSTGTAATYYSNFQSGDELMVVSGAGKPFTTITLTANGSASGSNIALSFTSTGSTGINSKDTPGPPSGTGLLLTTDALSTYLGVNYYASSPTTDWVIRLAPIKYYVDTTTPSDPKLMRQVGSATAVEVMDQIVSFKVGAALEDDNTGNYYYNSSATTNALGGFNNDFTLVRAIRVNLMARTPPNATVSYRNQFDGGPYQVLGSSVVINLRNMSMNDQ